MFARKWRIERSELVRAEPAAIFPLVNDFERGWKQWNPFVEPGMTIGYEGAREGVGAVSTWLRGRESGRMEILESDPFDGIVYDVKMPGCSLVGRFEFRREGDATRVTWSDEGEIANPFLRVLFFFMKGLLGRKLSLGLSRIKALAEKSAVAV